MMSTPTAGWKEKLALVSRERRGRSEPGGGGRWYWWPAPVSVEAFLLQLVGNSLPQFRRRHLTVWCPSHRLTEGTLEG